MYKKKMTPKKDEKRKPMMYGRTPMNKGKTPRYGMFEGGYASAMPKAKEL